jgi:hypothetical protein
VPLIGFMVLLPLRVRFPVLRCSRRHQNRSPLGLYPLRGLPGRSDAAVSRCSFPVLGSTSLGFPSDEDLHFEVSIASAGGIVSFETAFPP